MTLKEQIDKLKSCKADAENQPCGNSLIDLKTIKSLLKSLKKLKS